MKDSLITLDRNVASLLRGDAGATVRLIQRRTTERPRSTESGSLVGGLAEKGSLPGLEAMAVFRAERKK